MKHSPETFTLHFHPLALLFLLLCKEQTSIACLRLDTCAVTTRFLKLHNGLSAGLQPALVGRSQALTGQKRQGLPQRPPRPAGSSYSTHLNNCMLGLCKKVRCLLGDETAPLPARNRTQKRNAHVFTGRGVTILIDHIRVCASYYPPLITSTLLLSSRPRGNLPRAQFLLHS